MSKRLGKGLNALINDINVDEEQIEQIKISECRTNPYQPRKTFDADAIEELKISILEYGIIQPLIMRRSIKGYEIVAGERRYRAAKEAGLTEVPAIVKQFDDHQMMEIALLENLQRENLNIVEEATAYKNLMDELELTQEDLAAKLGKSRSHIANTVRLLMLPTEVIERISSGELSMGHGKALLSLKNKNKMQDIVTKVIKEKLNVRQVEKLIQDLNNQKQAKKETPKKSAFVIEYETVLRDKFGTSVNINEKGKKIELSFHDESDFNRLIELLSQ